MKFRKPLFLFIATGLLAFTGWKAFSYFQASAAVEQAQQWVCPMRCLNKVYPHAGECSICHMKLKQYIATEQKLLGYMCPLHRSEKIFEKGGTCPFCGLKLKEHYDGPPPLAVAEPGFHLWPLVNGKTAVYFRPFSVKKMPVDRIVRGAGRLKGLRVGLNLPLGEARALRPGAVAMVMPPQGFSRQVLATLVSIKGTKVELQLARPIPGTDWALVEIRVGGAPELAVPLAALAEDGANARVYLKRGEAYEPVAVTVTARGEAYAAVKGLDEGDVVAGSGLFWLESEWHMEHP